MAGVIKATDLVSEIAAASNEQSQGISQVNQGLGQIDQVTQQNAANAEESAAAAEELSGQAEQLRQMLAKFTLKSEQRQMQVILAPAGGKAIPLSLPETGNGAESSISRSAQESSAVSIALDDSTFGKY